MFDQLKMRIEQKVRDIEEAIANGADYVAEMKSVLQQGVETLNAIVADGKSDIQAYIAQAKTDLTKVKDDATEDITTTANNAKTSLEDTADTSINSITVKTTEATEHVDTKVAEFNQTVADNGFLTPDKLTEDLTALDWQKYKLTNEDGGYETISLDSDVEMLHSLNPGFCYLTSVPITGASSTAGYAHVETRTGISNIKIITFKPYSSSQIWVKRLHNEWSDWERVDNAQTDTGWVPFNLINGAEGNTVYKNSVDNGFDNAYRIIKNGDTTIKALRVSARNLTQAVTFAELPSNFSKHTQVMPVRTPRDLNGGLVEIKPDGKLVFQYYNWKMVRDWIDTDYIYGEFSWIE